MLKRDYNIGLVGVSAKWSCVTASPSHRDQAIPILSPLLFMHVGHPYFKIPRIFDLLVHVYLIVMYGTTLIIGTTLFTKRFT